MGAFPHIRYAAKSDIGRQRANNEDSFGAFPESGIFCVADGMGGGDDGEVASAATVKAIERFTKECPIQKKYTYPIEGIVSGVRNAVNSASDWIAKRTQKKGLKGCGSTFVCICFDAAKPNTAIALHAGDSRLYRIRGRTIEQITVDHSAAELIGAKDDKDINPMFRGMILRAVGIQPLVELERTEVQLKVGDRILICSDGLSRMVVDKRLLSIVRAGKELEEIVEKLVSAANDAGGIDNITVELIEVGEFPTPLPTSPLAKENKEGATGETRDAPIEDVSPDKTKGDSVLPVASTEDDFIASTARDGAEESGDEVLNIPESDTEDDHPDGVVPKAETVSDPIPFASLHEKRFICKLMMNRIFVFGVIVALIVVGSIVACVCSRASEEAEVKRAAEAKIHRIEQKNSLQTVEARRKAEIEQKARDAEERKTRLEILTHEKQKELDEKARKAAERRESEERAAREKTEAEARRAKEVKAQEFARQEELKRVAEARASAEKRREERLAREESARQELLRKVEVEKKRKEAEETRILVERQKLERKTSDAKAKQDLLINAFANIVKDGTAAKFHAKINERIPNVILGKLHQKLSQAGNAELARADRIEAIVMLTKDVQLASRELMEYSSLMQENIKSDLSDPMLEKTTKDYLVRVRDGIVAFDREAKEFVKLDASDPEAQMKCIGIIQSVPKWFAL